MFLEVSELRRLACGEVVTSSELELLRFELDVIDDKIVDLLASRFRRLERVAQVKACLELQAYDPAREAAIVARLAKRTELGPTWIDADGRRAVLEIAREVLTRGRAHVECRVKELRAARHDARDGTPTPVDPSARRSSPPHDP